MPTSMMLLSALRNHWHHKLHSLINLASLTLGLAVFSFAFLYVKQETSYDRSWPDAPRIHRLLVTLNGLSGTTDGEYANLVSRSYQPLVDNFADVIDKSTRFYETAVKPDDDTKNSYMNLTFVDPAFAEIFRLEVLSGSLDSVLQGPGFIALEESAAANYPTGKVAVGSRITLEGSYTAADGSHSKAEYEVGAIYRLPANVSAAVSFKMLTLKHDYSLQLFPDFVRKQIWDSSTNNMGVWLLLKPGADLAAIHARMPDYIDKAVTTYNSNLKPGERISAHLFYRFQPVTDLHLHPLSQEAFRSQSGGLDQVLIIAAIGALVLLVGCSNSISLGLAAVLERRRDIGIHKAVGALRNDLLLQYLGESVLLALLALILAIALVEWLLPVLQVLLRMPKALTLAPSDFALVGGISLAVGLASGAYPAFVLAGVKPQQVLKTGASGSGRNTNRLRTLLVGFQFCFAVILMIGTLALYVQLQVVRSQPLGFNPHNLVHVSPPENLRQLGSAAFLKELQKVSGVTAVASTGNPPNLNLPVTVGTVQFVNRSPEEIEIAIHAESIGAATLKMYGIALLAGRMFDEVRDNPDTKTGRLADQNADEEPETRVLLNRAAVRALGFANPQAAVDQIIFRRNNDRNGKVVERTVHIIGVIEDSMYSSLRRKPTPEAYRMLASSPTYSYDFVLKLKEAAAADAFQQEIKQVMLALGSSQPGSVRFIETLLAAEFTVEQNQGKLLLYCVGLALFLSCIGLFGLASFTLQRGIKEVGIRKSMGASVSSLTGLYLWRYAKPVLIATAVASPVASYFVLQWLQRFPYQLEKWWLLPLCLAAGGIVLVIALLTVAGIIIKTARAKPVQSLRYE